LGAGSLSQARTKASFDTYGLYAQATYKLTDQLSLTGGFRYTWDKTVVTAENTRTTVAAPPLVPGGIITCNDPLRFPGARAGSGKVVADQAECHYTFPAAKSHAPTWVIDAEYKPIDDLMLYAKYSRGYRQGGINPTSVGLETWQPEHIDAYEIGAKLGFNGAVSGYFNIAGFYNKLRDQQILVSAISNVPGFAGAQPVVNAGRSRIQGIEADASATFFDSLRLDAGYTYLDTLLQAFTPPAIPNGAPYGQLVPTAVVGGPLSQSPKHRLTLTGTYTLPLDESIGKISLSATYVYTSSQVFSHANDAFVNYVTGNGPLLSGQVPLIKANIPINANMGVLPATNLVNLNVNWNNVLGSTVDAAFFVTNLTNEIYPVSNGGGINSTGSENFNYAPPRMWGFRLRYSFGS
jgi:iron complex outermembrane receptor protein